MQEEKKQFSHEIDMVRALEAVLFVHGEPLSSSRLSEYLGIDEQAVWEIADALSRRLGGSALRILRNGEKMQLVTRPQFAALLESFAKSQLSDELTSASLEALAIVSYFGPVSRSHIEYLRGVNSAMTLRNLAIRGLIETIPDPQAAGVVLYQPTFDFLKHLGLEDKGELPDFQKFRELFAKALNLSVESRVSRKGETPQ